MFNDSKVSSFVQNQFPEFTQDQYPRFVEFLQTYYQHLESNGNPLDIIDNILDLIDVDTYSEIDLKADTKEPITIDDTEISVIGHVNFPRTDGLIKIDNEVILYKTREYITDQFGAYKITVFKDCIRGYSYNDLSYEDGFVSGIPTIPSAHVASSTVFNQSFSYLLYFLDKLRSQFLVNFPVNVLQENSGNINFNLILKKAKDFYLTKGTPKGIEFYFKFLFQDVPEINNYKQNLIAPSDSTYQSKSVIRTETLDNYFIPDLIGNSLVQGSNEFIVQTVENIFAGSSQVYELEITNGINILPTKFTVITSQIEGSRLYVDSTFGFPNTGFLRIGDELVTYSKAEYNYFELIDIPIFYELGQRVYDGSTLASVKDRPDSYFIIFAGINNFEITKNYSYYQEGDIGFVKDISIDNDNPKLNSWILNDNIPLKTNNNLVSGVSSLYTDNDSLYLYTSSIPYYDITVPEDVIIEDSRFYKKIPLTFTKTAEGFKEPTLPNQPVGFLVDGTPILNWKSNVVFTKGSLDRVDIIKGGQDFNVKNPPLALIDSPNSQYGGTTAQVNLVVNGSVKEVYVKNKGTNYPVNTIITVRKDPTDTVYTGVNFKQALLEPVIVKGRIARVKIIDPGFGYTKQPTIEISPQLNPVNAANIDLLVSGAISNVNITNPGSRYDADPNIYLQFGDGGSGAITIENGKITNVQLVNGGVNYKSPPIVKVVDSTGNGEGAKIISEINYTTGSITAFKILNPGINYSQFGTFIEVYESGSDQYLIPRVDKWTLLNNYNTNNNQYYNNTDGSLLFGTEFVQDQQILNPTFEEIPFVQKTSIEEIPGNPPVMRVHLNGISGPPIAGSVGDILYSDGIDLLDEGFIEIPVPFDIRFGSTSNTPTLVKAGEFIYINTNGFIYFKNTLSTLTGWAAEQVTPNSIGASIQIGRDDLIADKIFKSHIITNEATIYTANFEDLTPNGYELVGGGHTQEWPGTGYALFFFGDIQRSITSPSYDLSSGGNISFDLIYSTPQTVGEEPELGDEVSFQYSLDNGITWFNYRTFTFAQYKNGNWNTIVIPAVGQLKTQNLKFRLIQQNFNGQFLDSWGIDNLVVTVFSQIQTPDQFVIRYDGYHFVKGINKTNPIKFEVIFYENLNTDLIVDNKFEINIIENDALSSDNKQIALTFGDDTVYDLDVKQANTQTSYFYDTQIIPASDVKFPKIYTIIAAPKKLQTKSGPVEFANSTVHSKLIGWALDGSPIYGPYGYSNPLDPGSSIAKMTSGWKKIQITDAQFNPIRLTSAPLGGLQNYELGSFEEDYVWDQLGASLDKQNGRYCVTPEYPNGIYAYFMTVDVNDKQVGFPYFIGSNFSGTTYSEFNSKDFPDFTNVVTSNRYLNPLSSIYQLTRPLDAGSFVVDSVPSSVEAVVESIQVTEGGSEYKIGDTLVFDNSETEGFGAAGYVSVLNGKPVTLTTYNYYDYLRYDDENVPFTINSTIKTVDGFTANIHSINQSKKHLYLSNVTGSIPQVNDIIYDTNLTLETSVFSEIVGSNISTAVIGSVATTANLATAIDSATSYLNINQFTNCTISDFYDGIVSKYIRIDDEYMKVTKIVDSTHILVQRGIKSIQSSHSASSTITLLTELPVFDSSMFKIGDVIKSGDEIFKIVDISIRKVNNIYTKIIDGSGTAGNNTYYLYFDKVLQINSNAVIPAQGTVILDANGDVSDLVYDQPQTIIKYNPKVEILTSSTYNENNIVTPINIASNAYEHLLIVERQAFDTIREQHYPRTNVNRLIYVNAKVKEYKEDRILSRFTSQNNGLVQGDPITVFASRKDTINYNFALNGNTLSITNLQNNQLNFYEGSTYVFTVLGTSEPIKIQFYSPSENTNKQKEYFDVNLTIELDGNNNISKFTIRPDRSDLTELVMRFTSETTGIVKDVHVNTISEPYNGSYIIENSSTSFFEFDTDPTLESTSKNPLFTNYNQNTISYTTTSKNANGPIDKATLTSGGFGYKVLPKISSIKTANGIGASLEAISDTVGSVKRISSVNNGYGYIPNPSFSPIVSFPVICKLKNNFTVVSYSIESPGEGYLYNPEVVITDGGLSNLDPKHAILSAIISNERVFAMNIDFAGYSYSSAPKLDIQKLYFAGINSNGDLTFKFNFNKYFSENDSYKVRAYYYDQGGVLRYRESSRVFYADLQTASIKSRNAVNSIVYLDPRDYIDESNISVEYYKVDLLERKAIVNAVVDKSEFILGEKVIINNNSDIYGFVSDRKGWQKGNSILRITGLQYNLKPDDTIRGVNSEAYGQILTTDSVITKSSIGAYLEKPKQFLNTNSFLSENILKIQDSLRYQKFAYEISTNVPSNKWRENYQATAHPAGYNLFAKTKINQSAKETIQASSQVKISTDISSIVRLNQKYNYLISKNVGIDEVIVANRLLTDVKDIKTSVVAAFQDISDQFDGIKTSFELKVIDPVTPKLEDGITDKYITQYDVDQMVVVLDNIIQTYGESWTVTDSDKTFDFSSVQQDNQLMPDGDILYYRQLNDSNTVFGFNKITTSSATSFTLVQQDGSVFPSSVIGANYNVEDWLVFVDGALQLSGDSYTITSNQLVFDETIPTGSQISARCIIDSHRNEFANGSVTAGSAVTLSSKPITTSKESYFVFVDGILIATTDYNLDASNNVIFNYSFNYESLVIFIDAKGVSVETLSHNLLPQLYVYKIEDGQTDIPVGTVLDSNKYILDINGVVQTPFVSYVAGASGVRKINFTEPPQKYVKPDLTVGRQFLALLYQRQDVDGTNGSTPNYQFDDISKNRIFVKNPVTNIIVGDYITNDTSQSIVVDKIDVRVRKVTLSTVSATVTANSTFTLVVNEISNISVGDRVVFDVAIGLTRVEGDELEITAINRETNTLTIKNISSTSLQLNIPLNIGIRFSHRELIVQNISTNVGNRDNAYVSGTTLRSGYISSTFTGTETTLNETYGVLKTDTTITVTDASSIVANDYLLINNVEVVKVVSKSSNVLTVSRSQLATSAPDFHANGSIVEEIIPESILCSGFQRGFDGNKTSFRLLEKENPVFIQSNKDIFVIVNGILQKRGSSYSIVENDPDGISESGDEFSTLVFTEAPSDGTPFNCFYVGETVAIENISSQFNGIKTSFDLRSTGGEIFSLIANGRPEANISANLILFIDGVYQIPSTSEPNRLEAYSENIKSFTLLGSIIDFTAPPKNGSDFEGYIYVGSINDYESIDVDATVEDDDILIQYNEVAPRRILQRTSATKVSVSESFGVKSPNSQGINIGTILTEENINWWKTDLIKKARVRESLRARRNLISSIYDFAGTSPYPLSGKTLYTTAIPKIQLAKVSFDLPNSPDDDTNKISFILPATTNFDQRIINCTYVSFVPRNPLIFNSKDELQNVSVGYDLPFDQIVKLETLASSETFEDEIGNEFLTYGPSNQYSAFVVNWDQSKRILYLKLSNTLNPVTQGVHTLKNYAVTSDNLINEYQTLAISNQFIYTF